MRAFVIHDIEGNIRAVVTASPDAPPIGPPAGTGDLVSEVELEDYPLEAGDEEMHGRLVKLAQEQRVEFQREARLVPRSDSAR
jgi:hypothetical protein